MLILVETGPALYLLRHEHISAAAVLLGGLAADDRVAIASYSETPLLQLNFTADKRQALGALGSLNYGLGMAQLNFYDSLAAALDWTAFRGKRAIVALTTGLDSSGAAHWDRLQARIRQSDVMVLPVALGGALRETNAPGRAGRKNHGANGRSAANSEGASANAGSHTEAGKPAVIDTKNEISFAESTRALEAIASESGGHAFFPRAPGDFQQAYSQIAAILRHYYSLGFNTSARDGRYHTIQIEAVDNEGRAFNGKEHRPAYRLNARRGFLAPAP